MKYAYILNGSVHEIIPEFDPVFPGIPVTKRYPAQFLAETVLVEEEVDVQCNMLYDADTGTFSWPEPVPEPEPVEPGVIIPPEPTLEERNRADIDYLALMMGVELL